MKFFFSLLTLIGLATFSTYAQTMPDTATMNFINKATIGGLQEVKSGDLAVKKGQSQDVKSFGARMIADHNKANAQLTALVKSKGIQIPPQASVVTPDVMLVQASGAAFDKTYVDMMVGDHQSTVNLFQNYAVTGKDPDLKAFAQQTLPTLKDHLASIKAIAAKMNSRSM